MAALRLTTLHTTMAVLDAFRGTEVPPEVLLEGSGIQLSDVELPNSLINIGQELRVFANALAFRQDLGLALGRCLHISAYGMFGLTLLTSANLREGLTLALRYPLLLGTFFRLGLEIRDGLAWLTADQYSESPELEVFNTDFCMSSFRVTCQDLLGCTLPLREAQFVHPQPDYLDAYEQAFNCPVHFNAGRNAIGFDLEWLDRRLPLADLVTHGGMLERCIELNEELSARPAWIDQVRRILSEQLHAVPDFDSLARQVHCSPSTLRRRLRAQDSSYQKLLDELRYKQAKQLLAQQNLSVCRIAEALGFKETASFRHAFQRWSGVAPGRFRQLAGQSGPLNDA